MNLADAERLFHQALELPSAQERSAFLKGACGDHDDLRRHVEALIEAHEKTAPFLPTEPGDRTVIETPSEGPGSVIGRYKLLQQIGEGGMGVVYMAEQTQPLVRKVALKIIKLGMDTRQVVARFEAERQALALMDHPNIAKVLDAGATDTGRPYFVMELVRGIPITEYCDKNRLSARQRLELLIPVCQAIQHAHQKGIIHRDIKPSNILVTLVDGQPLPMVIDFGIAKALHQRLTEKTLYTNFAQMIGTPAYMSPEQAEMSKLDVDTRTDIYSLGVLLYELLTGTTPFSAKELLEAGYAAMQRIIVEQEPPRPSTRLSTMQQAQRTSVAQNRRMEPSALTRLFQGDLDWIVMKCLEKERGRRYETASALAADLQRHLQSEPVTARPPTAAYRLQKAIRRNRVAFAAGGAVMLTLVLGTVVSAWQAIRAINAEREQVTLREKAEKAAGQEATARKQAEEAGTNEREQRQRAEASEQNARRLLYAANLKLIQQAWTEDNLPLIRGLLTDTVEAPYLGFEWYYWQRQIHGEIANLSGHQGMPYSIAWSPDGRTILSGSEDKTSRIWEADSGKEVRSFKPHDAQTVTAVAYSPDGQQLLTAGMDRMARLWDAVTLRELRVLSGHSDAIGDAAFAPNGQMVATIGADGSARIWALPSGRLLHALALMAAGEGIYSVAYSADSARILTTGADSTARLWDVRSGTELTRVRVEAGLCHLSPDGRRIAIARPDGIHVWDVAEGAERPLVNLPLDHAYIKRIRFSPDGQKIATVQGARIDLWDAATGRRLSTIKDRGEVVFALAFSPDGRRIATGDQKGGIRVYDAGNQTQDVMLEGHLGLMTAAFSPDATRCLTVHWDGKIVVRDTANGRELLVITREDHDIGVATFSPDGRRIFGISQVIDPNGLPVRRSSGKVQSWEAATGELLATVNTPEGVLVACAMAPDGQRLVTVADDGAARVWEVSTGREVFSLRRHAELLTSVGYSPDGARIVTSAIDRTVRVWDAETGRQVFLLRGHSGSVGSIAFSANGSRILTGGGYYDRTARVWEASTGRELLSLAGHAGSVASVAYCPDDRRIITTSLDDGTIRLWDTVSGNELLKLDAGGVRHACLTPDGKRILAVVPQPADQTSSAAESWLSALPMIRTWAAASPDQVAAWQQQERQATAQTARAPLPAHPNPPPPPRPPGLPAQLVDLSGYYNASTRDDWHNPDDKGNNLAELHLGVQDIGGVRFDVRGIIQLAGTAIAAFRPDYPDAIRGIRVGQKAAALHFLHGTGWSPGELADGHPGIAIAWYFIRYADGRVAAVPIRYGEDVRNWQFGADSVAAEHGGAQPAWQGTQERWRKTYPDLGVRLYLKTWRNPRPAVAVESLDFVSAFTPSAPFLLAITVEPPVPGEADSRR